MKKLLLLSTFGLFVGLCSAQESNQVQEVKLTPKKEAVNQAEFNANTKAVQKFNTDKVKLDKVNGMKYNAKDEEINNAQHPSNATIKAKPSSSAVKLKD